MIQPYYQDECCTIYHADALAVLHLIEMPAVVIVDPPYGIDFRSDWDGSGSKIHGVTIRNDDTTIVRDKIIDHFRPIVPMLVFGTWRVERPHSVREVLVWDKGSSTGMGDLSLPWKRSWEEIYVLGNGFVGSRDEAVLRGFRSNPGKEHPNEKPVELMGYLISKSPVGVVLDPCCGTGPTLRAAKDRGRKAIGIEIDEKWCEAAAKRLAQETLRFGS